MYPYKSPIKQAYANTNPIISGLLSNDSPPDFQVKPLKKYFRPVFSPHTNAWEADLAFNDGSKQVGYLFIINENTRFVFAWPIYSKDTETLAAGFLAFLNHFGHRPISIKGDGEKGFQALADRMSGKKPLITSGRKADRDGLNTVALCSNDEYKRNVRWVLINKQRNFTNSFPVIDRAIRTIRDILNVAFDRNSNAFANHNHFFQALKIYNNSVHTAFKNRYTPKEMQENPELEYAYIRMKQHQLDEARLTQGIGGYAGFKPGDELMIHIPWQKTSQRFAKQRRSFSDLATFIGYEGGNAVVRVKSPPPGIKDIIVLPIYYIKRVQK
jgi:hypothetical protein